MNNKEEVLKEIQLIEENNKVVKEEIQDLRTEIDRYLRVISENERKILSLKENYYKAVCRFFSSCTYFKDIENYQFFNFIKRQTGRRWSFLKNSITYNFSFGEHYIDTTNKKSCVWNNINKKLSCDASFLFKYEFDLSNSYIRLEKMSKKYKKFTINNPEVLKKVFLISFSERFKFRFNYNDFKFFCNTSITNEQFDSIYNEMKLDFFFNISSRFVNPERTKEYLINEFNFKEEDFTPEVYKLLRIKSTVALLAK